MQCFRRQPTSPTAERRSGAVIVETALCVPVFAVFLAGLMEFGHAYLVIGTLNAAARAGAREGAVEGITTADVTAESNRILGSAFDNAHATIMVKDASIFDTPGMDPSSVNYSSLNDVEVSNLEAGDMFLVRIEVPYDNLAVLPPFWAKSLTLKAQAVTRHE